MMMKQVKWFLPVVVLLLSSIFSGCDLCGYSQPERWLKLPTAIDREVDVFYLYPTCWKKIDPSEPNICAIDNPTMLAGSAAAYVIGYSVTTDYLQENPHLRFAEGPDDTGVIVSYNTLSPDVALEDVPFLLPGAVAINPISWTRDETLATTGEGLGSYLPDANGVFHQAPQYADARVDTAAGVVICSTALETELVLGFGPGIYHTYDIPFYYFNLRANAANRTEKFLESL